jgi:Transcriptional regulator
MDQSTSLLKALDILTVIGGSAGGRLTVQELAELMNLPRTTVIRILNTIVGYGLVERKGRRYATTLAFRRWSAGNRNAENVRRYRNLLTRIAEATGELVLLGLLEVPGRAYRLYRE